MAEAVRVHVRQIDDGLECVRRPGYLLEVPQRPIVKKPFRLLAKRFRHVRKPGFDAKTEARRLDHVATLRKIVRTILRSVVRWSGKPAGADSGFMLRRSRRPPAPIAAPRRARGDRRRHKDAGRPSARASSSSCAALRASAGLPCPRRA